MNNNAFNVLMPHWASAYNHWHNDELSIGRWFGYKVLAICEAIPLIGRIVLFIEKNLYKEKAIASSKPLSEKIVEPIKPAEKDTVDPKIADPLALSIEEVALCAQGTLLGVAALTGNYWLKLFSAPFIGTSLLRSAVYVGPTTPLGSFITGGLTLWAAGSSGVSLHSKESDPNAASPLALAGMALVSSPLAPAPIRVGLQAALTLYQMKQAFTGIGTALSQIGTGDSTKIMRNLAVHSINIATSGYNLATRFTDIIPELSYYGSATLSNVVSESYAKEVMGAQCRGYFYPEIVKTVEPALKNYPGYLPKVKFAWDTGYHFLHQTFGWLAVPVNSLCGKYSKEVVPYFSLDIGSLYKQEPLTQLPLTEDFKNWLMSH